MHRVRPAEEEPVRIPRPASEELEQGRRVHEEALQVQVEVLETEQFGEDLEVQSGVTRLLFLVTQGLLELLRNQAGRQLAPLGQVPDDCPETLESHLLVRVVVVQSRDEDVQLPEVDFLVHFSQKSLQFDALQLLFWKAQ